MRSENRKRQHVVLVRMLADERTAIEASAREAALSVPSYLRACAIGTPGPRAQRSPTLEAEALGRAMAALNKAGSNLAEMANAMIVNGSSATNDCFAALAETRGAAAAIRELVGRKDR